MLGNPSPRNPGAAVKPRRQLELPGHSARQHDGFKRIQKHYPQDHQTKNDCDDASVVRAHVGCQEYSKQNFDAEGRLTDSNKLG
jgi:hypothetical protein